MPADYTLMDATLEILLMLLAAFLLGWLFCWLMKKLFGRKPEAAYQPTHINLDKPTLRGTNHSGIVSSNKDRLYSADADLDLTVETPNIGRQRVNLNEVDLPNSPTIDPPAVALRQGTAASFEHTTPEIEPLVSKPEVSSSRPRIELPGFNTPDLDVKGKVDAGIDTGKATINKGLGLGAAGIGAVALGASSLKDKAVDKVRNIDLNIDTPKVETPDITTRTPELSQSDKSITLTDPKVPDFETEIDLPEVEKIDLNTEIDLPSAPEVDTPTINTDGITVETHAPSIGRPNIDLPDVKLASSETLKTGKRKLGAGLGAAAAGLGAVAAGAASLKDSAVEKVDNLGDKLTRPDLPISSEAAESIDNKVVQSQLEADDLTRISGIDQQIESVLNNKGIHRYQDLQGTNRTQLKGYLDETNNVNLREIEPASWPHQATLCANRNWTKLSEYQSFLTGNNLGARQTLPTYDVDDGDDLKKIEGIGPFFESLLNDAGITTYEHLKNAERDTLKEIIDAAGPDYRMHEPETWPYQAGLAHRGEWKKLQDYINFMTGRG